MVLERPLGLHQNVVWRTRSCLESLRKSRAESCAASFYDVILSPGALTVEGLSLYASTNEESSDQRIRLLNHRRAYTRPSRTGTSISGPRAGDDQPASNTEHQLIESIYG